MAVGFEFGIDQLGIHLDFEFASVRGNQYQGLEIEFKLLQQFIGQAHGPVSVMSDGTVNDFNREHQVVLHSVILAERRGSLTSSHSRS